MSEIKNTFIYLLGFPGTGKLTIAEELQKLIPSILVDNHLINNVVFSLIDTDGKTRLPPKVWEHTWAIRRIVLDTIKNISKPQRNFIFTNALVDEVPEDKLLFEEIVDLAKARDAFLFPVRLLVSTEELVRRVVSPGRIKKFKGIDPESAQIQSRTQHVFTPANLKCLDLDVTSLTAPEAAMQICNALKAAVIRS